MNIHWTFLNYRDQVQKHNKTSQIHLFQTKLHMLLAPLTGHFTVKVLSNVQEETKYHLPKCCDIFNDSWLQFKHKMLCYVGLCFKTWNLLSVVVRKINLIQNILCKQVQICMQFCISSTCIPRIVTKNVFVRSEPTLSEDERFLENVASVREIH